MAASTSVFSGLPFTPPFGDGNRPKPNGLDVQDGRSVMTREKHCGLSDLTKQVLDGFMASVWWQVFIYREIFIQQMNHVDAF
jgi:hypothetical protein